MPRRGRLTFALLLLIGFSVLILRVPVLVLLILVLVLLILFLVLILVLTLVLLLLVLLVLLVLILVLVLLVVAAASVLILIQQPFLVGVVVLGLHVRGVEPQRLLVTFKGLLVLLLLELGVSEVVEGFGTLRVGAQRIGRSLHHGLFRLGRSVRPL